MRLLAHQFRFEQLLFWRSREAAFFVFTFPLILFVLLSSVYQGRYLGRPASWSVLAGILGYGAANTGFGGLTLLLVGRREMGFLKRVRSTPIPGATYLTAQEHQDSVLTAGFSDVKVFEEQAQGWICAMGKKPAGD